MRSGLVEVNVLVLGLHDRLGSPQEKSFTKRNFDFVVICLMGFLIVS